MTIMMLITAVVIVVAYQLVAIILYDRHVILKEHRNGLIIRPYKERKTNSTKGNITA